MAPIVGAKIDTVTWSAQRYATTGDWTVYPSGELAAAILIKTTDLGDWRMNMCTAVHEFVEALICAHKEIPQSAVDEFDLSFEKNKETGIFGEEVDEPGECPAAPYYHAHQIATQIERILAHALDVHWPSYEERADFYYRRAATYHAQRQTHVTAQDGDSSGDPVAGDGGRADPLRWDGGPAVCRVYANDRTATPPSALQPMED